MGAALATRLFAGPGHLVGQWGQARVILSLDK